MGSEGKSKKKRRSPSISEDEGRKSKKRRTRDDRERERKSSRSDRKEKKKSKKSHRRSRDHEDKGTKSSGKHGHKHKKQSSVQELTSDDYFSKNNEFSTWLKEEKGLFFNDLSSETARNLFSDFVEDWNSKTLESRYYDGIASAPRTAHNWKVKS